MRLVTEWPVERGLVARAALLLLAAATALPGCRTAAPVPAAPTADTEAVGRHGGGRTVLPVNQVVTPPGLQVELPGLRPQALALSPDGRLLLTAGKTAELVVVDPATGAVRQRVPLPKTKANPKAPSANILEPDKEGQVSFTGLRFAPDGRRAFLSDVNGSVVVFDVAADGTVARRAHDPRCRDANAPRRQEEIPAGLAVSADGARLYVCGNLSNTLLELDVADGRVLRDVRRRRRALRRGARRRQGVRVELGRPPAAGRAISTGPAGRGTVVQGRPGAAHRQRGVGDGDRPRESGEDRDRDRDRPARERPRRVAGRPATSSAPTRRATP